ncbi:PGF-CTERM sorting domain-containing protein [Haladaptatus pallidirubidus]|uniref:PGF-CTERM archaeal protein-sorting signal domain-containing protein n=1 Tax=Haladaptatus pallidirubidus TaxID=1008152 RepID=A0AAV3ULT6_9EURY|nr:PGF-CTERM sorting domain-containing protein [Haladaptatus pallidirubidus]
MTENTEDGDSSGETTTENGTTEDTESDGQPGFGIGLALTALAGVALLVRRR